MGYSCWCSHLNLTIHFAKSPDHFPYSVTLGTKGLVISHLCTRVPFETATSSTRGRSLYPTFVVYLRTIHGPLSFISCHHPKVTFTEWIILLFKELLRSFPNCFTNLSQNIQSVKFFLNFFLDLTFRVSFITCRCQILYKYKDKYSPDKQNRKKITDSSNF